MLSCQINAIYITSYHIITLSARITSKYSQCPNITYLNILRVRAKEMEEESAVGDMKFLFPKECGDDIWTEGDKQIYGIGSFLVILFAFCEDK